MQTSPLPLAPSSSNGLHTIQVYDADGVRISFVCVKDSNDHFRFGPAIAVCGGCAKMLTLYHLLRVSA